MGLPNDKDLDRWFGDLYDELLEAATDLLGTAAGAYLDVAAGHIALARLAHAADRDRDADDDEDVDDV